MMGDDAIGCIAVDTFPYILAGVDYAVTPESGLALLDYLVNRTWAVLVDAVPDDTRPWRVSIETLTSSNRGRFAPGPHSWGLGKIIGQAEALGLRVPQQIHLVKVHIPSRNLYRVRPHCSKKALNLIPEIHERLRTLLRMSQSSAATQCQGVQFLEIEHR